MWELLGSGVQGDVEWHLLLVLPPMPLSRLCRAWQGATHLRERPPPSPHQSATQSTPRSPAWPGFLPNTELTAAFLTAAQILLGTPQYSPCRAGDPRNAAAHSVTCCKDHPTLLPDQRAQEMSSSTPTPPRSHSCAFFSLPGFICRGSYTKHFGS